MWKQKTGHIKVPHQSASFDPHLIASVAWAFTARSAPAYSAVAAFMLWPSDYGSAKAFDYKQDQFSFMSLTGSNGGNPLKHHY